MIRKRRKKVRMRGSTTHGHGNKKNARGSGTRGGTGLAGSHKHKFTKYYLKFGKKGFKPKTRKSCEELNLRELNECIKAFKEKKQSRLSSCFKEENNVIVCDLSGRNIKLLANGFIEGKVIIRNAAACSENAKKKIEETTAGGTVE
ncbi:uL15 family ribosomal protein [archaeon]|nr:uL15 family ribosomal protein [archaeon]